MADIVFKYDEMNTAVTQIKDLASQYRSAAGTFESDFLSAIGSWEGENEFFYFRPCERIYEYNCFEAVGVFG